MSEFLHDTEALDNDFTELPDHLQYRPYSVPNPCKSVGPRYLEPRKEPPPRNYTIPNFEAKRTGPFAGVESRLLDPRSPRRQMEVPVPYQEKREHMTHVEYTKARGIQATPKLFETKEVHPNPREVIEQQKDRDRRLLGWRSNPVGNLCLTFDEIRNRNKHLLRRSGKVDHLDEKPKRNTPSVIRDYVRHGTPPRHYTTTERYIELGKERRERARTATRQQRFTPGGGAGRGSWTSRPNSPRSASLARENARIQEYRLERSETVVSKKNVPRVAKLSPSASLQRWESHRSTTSETVGTSATPNRPISRSVGGSPSPAARTPPPGGKTMPPPPPPPPRNGSPSRQRQTDNDGTLLVGPVTVAVPPGAIVRLSSHPTTA